MRLQNTTSCTGKYYAISEQNMFTDLLCLFLLFVCLLLCQINPTKCVNLPKCAVGGKRLLDSDFEVMAVKNRLNVVILVSVQLLVASVAKVEHDTAGQVEEKSFDAALHFMCSLNSSGFFWLHFRNIACHVCLELGL